MEQTETLSHTAFAETFLEHITEFLRERPAYLKLLAAPIRFSRDPAARRALRVAIANAFRAKDPSLPNEKAMLAANITLQMVKGITTFYAEAGPGEKPLIIAEYKKALTLYLGSVFCPRTSSLQKEDNDNAAFWANPRTITSMRRRAGLWYGCSFSTVIKAPAPNSASKSAGISVLKAPAHHPDSGEDETTETDDCACVEGKGFAYPTFLVDV